MQAAALAEWNQLLVANLQQHGVPPWAGQRVPQWLPHPFARAVPHVAAVDGGPPYLFMHSSRGPVNDHVVQVGRSASGMYAWQLAPQEHPLNQWMRAMCCITCST